MKTEDEIFDTVMQIVTSFTLSAILNPRTNQRLYELAYKYLAQEGEEKQYED